MTKKLTGSALAFGALLVLATPAMAKEPTGTAGAAATTEAAPATNTKYCFNTETTGSRMKTKVCKTRDQWLAEGVDPKKPNADQ